MTYCEKKLVEFEVQFSDEIISAIIISVTVELTYLLYLKVSQSSHDTLQIDGSLER